MVIVMSEEIVASIYIKKFILVTNGLRRAVFQLVCTTNDVQVEISLEQWNLN